MSGTIRNFIPIICLYAKRKSYLLKPITNKPINSFCNKYDSKSIYYQNKFQIHCTNQKIRRH